jgi:hypothetical protein
LLASERASKDGRGITKEMHEVKIVPGPVVLSGPGHSRSGSYMGFLCSRCQILGPSNHRSSQRKEKTSQKKRKRKKKLDLELACSGDDGWDLDARSVPPVVCALSYVNRYTTCVRAGSGAEKLLPPGARAVFVLLPYLTALHSQALLLQL